VKISGTVYRRKDTGRWGASLWVDNMRVRQETHFDTKTEAKAARQQWENELLNGRYVAREQESVTVADLLKYRREELVRQGAKALESFDANALAINDGPKKKGGKLRGGGLGSIPAAALTAGMVDKFRDRCVAAGLAKATADKYVEELRAALSFGVEKGRLARAPKLSFFKPDNRRTGFFEQAEHEAVRAVLPQPFADVAHFAYLSGWRRDEIETLTWDRLDRKGCEVWIWDSKNGDRRTLPYRLNNELVELIERRWQARQHGTSEAPKLSELVFHVKGRPPGDWRRRWQKACVAAGVGRLTGEKRKDGKERLRYVGKLFHDYRRTAVRDLTRAGVDRVTAKLITGHRSDSVFERYAIMTEREKEQGLAKLAAFRESSGSTTDLLRKPISGDFGTNS
jgi:integrase